MYQCGFLFFLLFFNLFFPKYVNDGHMKMCRIVEMTLVVSWPLGHDIEGDSVGG